MNISRNNYPKATVYQFGFDNGNPFILKGECYLCEHKVTAFASNPECVVLTVIPKWKQQCTQIFSSGLRYVVALAGWRLFDPPNDVKALDQIIAQGNVYILGDYRLDTALINSHCKKTYKSNKYRKEFRYA